MYGKELLDILREMGVELSLDWDGSLLVEAPVAVPGDVVVFAAEKHSGVLIQELHNEAYRARSRFYGGPLDGQAHRESSATYVLVHTARAEWHVYQVDKEERAIYVGKTTSKQKARLLGYRKGTYNWSCILELVRKS